MSMPVHYDVDGNEPNRVLAGGKTVFSEARFHNSVAGAYAANDYIGTSSTPMVFLNCARVPGGTGIIESCVIADLDNQVIALELWLFNQSIIPPLDNAAWTVTDTEFLYCVGVVAVATFYAGSAAAVGVARSVGLAFQCAQGSTSLYGALVTRGAPTYTDGSLLVRLGILQD